MIQRIQTIYLLLAAILMGLLFVFPLGEFYLDSGDFYSLDALGFRSIDLEELKVLSTLPLTILTLVIGLVSVANIFLYTNRVRQMRITIFTLLLIMGLVGLCIFYIITLRNQLLADLKYSVGLVLPLVAAIFTFLAYKRIKQDETLVRSYDRIR